MLTPSWVRSAAGVVLAALLLVGGKHCYDGHVAKDALTKQALSASRAAERAAKQSEARWMAREAVQHARADSVTAVTAAQARVIDSLSHRITITAPGVIRVASRPIAGEHIPPVVTVTVPPVVTDFMQAQAAQIATLTVQLATADSGWTAADSVSAAQGRQTAALAEQVRILRSQRHRLGFTSGVIVGVVGVLGTVYLLGRLN